MGEWTGCSKPSSGMGTGLASSSESLLDMDRVFSAKTLMGFWSRCAALGDPEEIDDDFFGDELTLSCCTVCLDGAVSRTECLSFRWNWTDWTLALGGRALEATGEVNEAGSAKRTHASWKLVKYALKRSK